MWHVLDGLQLFGSSFDMGKPAKVHCMLGFDADEIAAATETICRDHVASMAFSILIGLLLGSL